MSERYSVVYSPKAREDLHNIDDYITYRLKAPAVAEELVLRLREQVRSLSSFPERHPLMEDEPWYSMNMRRLSVKGVVGYELAHPLAVEQVRVLRAEGHLHVERGAFHVGEHECGNSRH